MSTVATTPIVKKITIGGNTISYIKETDSTGTTTYSITNGDDKPITTMKDSNNIEYTIENFPKIIDGKSYEPAIIKQGSVTSSTVATSTAPVVSSTVSSTVPSIVSSTTSGPAPVVSSSLNTPVTTPVIDEIEENLKKIILKNDYQGILSEIKDLSKEENFFGKDIKQLNTYIDLLKYLKKKYDIGNLLLKKDETIEINNALNNLEDIIIKQIGPPGGTGEVDNPIQGGSKNSKKYKKNNKKSKRKQNKNRNMTFKNSPKN